MGILKTLWSLTPPGMVIGVIQRSLEHDQAMAAQTKPATVTIVDAYNMRRQGDKRPLIIDAQESYSQNTRFENVQAAKYLNKYEDAEFDLDAIDGLPDGVRWFGA